MEYCQIHYNDYRSDWFSSLRRIFLTLYSRYITEKTDDLILETETAFVTYSYPDEKTVYIKDIYVHPDYRKSYMASNIADEVVAIAKSKGCTKVIGSIVPTTKNSTDSVKVLLAYGMKLDSSTNNFILFSKEIA